MIKALFIWITGKLAAVQAIFVISIAGNLARNMRNGATGGKSAATKPKIVTGATRGAANTFAKIEVIDKYPLKATMIGEQRMVAAIGSANPLGNFKRGAIIKRPAVANTDKAKPGSLACQGSAKITAAIANPSEGIESLFSRWDFAKITTAAIAAARNTDGDGRTKPINAIKTIEVANNLIRILLIGYCINQSTNELTMAKLAPLTAVRWVNPDLRMASLNSGVCNEVSPNTIPGISGVPNETFLKPPLIFPNICCQQLAPSIGSNFSQLRNIAATRGSLLSNNFPLARNLELGKKVSPIPITRIGTPLALAIKLIFPFVITFGSVATVNSRVNF